MVDHPRATEPAGNAMFCEHGALPLFRPASLKEREHELVAQGLEARERWSNGGDPLVSWAYSAFQRAYYVGKELL